MAQSRYWCFTIHSTNQHPYQLSDYDFSKSIPKITYLITQAETSPSTNQEHWQGYVEFERKQRINAVKEALYCDWAHLETRKGTQDQARAYCRKAETSIPDTQYEYGIIDPSTIKMQRKQDEGNYLLRLFSRGYWVVGGY